MVDVGKEKGKFRLRLSFEKWLTPLHLWVWYDLVKQRPHKLTFDRFQDESLLEKALECPHKDARISTTRFFIKEVPQGATPFSLKLGVCGNCGAPVSSQFIVYPKGVENYPKVKDMVRHQIPGTEKPPKAEVLETQGMGVM